MRAESVDDQGSNKEKKSALQIAVLAAFIDLCRIRCQGSSPFPSLFRYRAASGLDCCSRTFGRSYAFERNLPGNFAGKNHLR